MATTFEPDKYFVIADSSGEWKKLFDSSQSYYVWLGFEIDDNPSIEDIVDAFQKRYNWWQQNDRIARSGKEHPIASVVHSSCGQATKNLKKAKDTLTDSNQKLEYDKKLRSEIDKVAEQKFIEHIHVALGDDQISREEKTNLLKWADKLKISRDRAEEIIAEEMKKGGATYKVEKEGGTVEETYYETLGVPERATMEEIKSAHIKLVKIWRDKSTKEGAAAGARLIYFDTIYYELSDSKRRAQYDAKLKIKRESSSKFSAVLDFRSGENAKSLLEAANLIDKYWEEGKKKLTSGDLAGWLGRNGNSVLADEVRAIEQTEENKDIAMEKAIQAFKVGKEKPVIKIDPSILKIGHVEWGKSITKTIKILNDGSRGYLYGDVNVFPNIKGITFSQTKIGLPPGQNHEIEIQIDARNIPVNKYDIKIGFATNGTSVDIPVLFRVSASLTSMIGRSMLAGLVFGGVLGSVRLLTQVILSVAFGFSGNHILHWVSWVDYDGGAKGWSVFWMPLVAGIFIAFIIESICYFKKVQQSYKLVGNILFVIVGLMLPLFIGIMFLHEKMLDAIIMIFLSPFVFWLVIPWVSINIFVVGDKFLGAWATFPPALSWVIVGFLVGTLAYFAVHEAKKLPVPGIQPLIMVCAGLLLIVTPIVGPYTKHFISTTITNSTVLIPATQPWTDTGIYVKAGQGIQIKASGSVNGTNSERDGSWKWVGPNGWGYIPSYATNRRHLLPEGKSFMALVGRIGNGDPFLIGESYESKTTQSGNLLLGTNDVAKPEGHSWWLDNQGSFNVNIVTFIKETIIVDSNREWTTTGITIEKGNAVGISAHGKITWDPTLGEKGQSDPEGAPWAQVLVSRSPTQFPAPELPLASLIGRVGGGKPFLVGNYTTIRSDMAGELLLGLNDRQTKGSFEDNNGSFEVTIIVFNPESVKEVKSIQSNATGKLIPSSSTDSKRNSGLRIQDGNVKTRNKVAARSVSIVEKERALSDRKTYPLSSDHVSIKDQQTDKSLPEPSPNHLAKITIKTIPSNATIHIDKKHIGETPLTINMDFGPHGIQIQKNGYQDKFEVFRVTQNGRNEFVYDLKQQ